MLKKKTTTTKRIEIKGIIYELKRRVGKRGISKKQNSINAKESKKNKINIEKVEEKGK